MESTTLKMPVLCHSGKKLKQATLPFGALKADSNDESTKMKKQKLEVVDIKDTDFNGADSDEDVVILDASLDKNPESKMPNSTSSCLRKSESPSAFMYKVEDVNRKCDESCKTENTTMVETVENGSVTPDVIIESCSPPHIELPGNDRVSLNNGICQNSKRKVENSEKLEQKPPKRAKLIYHVDKLKTFEYVAREQNVPVKSSQIDRISENGVQPGETEDAVKEPLKLNASVNILESESKKEELQTVSFPSSGSSSVKENVPVLNAEAGEDTKLSLGNPVTPSRKRSSCSPGKGSEKVLTPKQLERKAEREKKKEERELILQEKKRKKEEMKEEKERLKLEKVEEKKKLREEKEKKRQAEIELKNEEKRKKEEEKRKKEEIKLEEKRKKEEQKLEGKRKKEELQRKKEEEEEMLKKKITKEAAVFSSFFKKFDVKAATVSEEEKSSSEVVFMPFTTKADMRLAPINRNPMDEARRLLFEELYNRQSEVNTYILELRSGAIFPKKSGNTWPLEEKYEEVVVLDEGIDLEDQVASIPQKKYNGRRPKLLQFCENRRPPYWGTWRKKSKSIRPKNPLGKDEIFDYEVDSDDEWEEEEPGESLHGSDDEKESEDEYEVDNDFFVPHGYLSDDENPEDETFSPETQKVKLKLLEKQFDMERNEKMKLLKPITIGCVWFDSETDEPASVNPSVVKLLNKRKAVLWTDVIPIPVLQDENADPNESVVSDGGTPTSSKKMDFPDSAIPDLIALIHGSTNSCKNLSKMFLSQLNKKDEEKATENEGGSMMLSQARVKKKIKQLAKWEEFPEEGPCYKKWCWYVKKEVREKFGLADLTISIKGEESTDKESDISKKGSPSLITKFTKVLSEDERRNQISTARRSISAAKPSSECNPKSQLASLKATQKLQQFWARSSLDRRKSQPGLDPPGCNRDSDADIEIIELETTENPPDAGVTKTGSDRSTENESSALPVVDGGETEAESGKSNSNPDKTSVQVSNMELEVDENTDKMDVEESKEGEEDAAEVVVSSVEETSSTVTEKEVDAPSLSSSREVSSNTEIRNQELGETLSVKSGKVEQTLPEKLVESKKENVNDGTNPAPKKRVAILFSAPRGCDIVKPPPRQPTRSIDDVVKKYEKEGATESVE